MINLYDRVYDRGYDTPMMEYMINPIWGYDKPNIGV